MPKRYDDASFGVSNQTTSADNQLTVSSGEECDSENFSEHDSDDLTARSLFIGKNDGAWFTTCPSSSRIRACNPRHTEEG